jgi:hypothetical protein
MLLCSSLITQTKRTLKFKVFNTLQFYRQTEEILNPCKYEQNDGYVHKISPSHHYVHSIVLNGRVVLVLLVVLVLFVAATGRRVLDEFLRLTEHPLVQSGLLRLFGLPNAVLFLLSQPVDSRLLLELLLANGVLAQLLLSDQLLLLSLFLEREEE